MQGSVKTSKLFLLALSCFIAVSCGKVAQEPQAAKRSIEVVADEYLEAMLERFPETATYYSLPGARHDDLYDNSLDAQAAWQAREDAWLRELEEIGTPTDIGSRDWVTFGILHEQLAGSITSRVCRNALWQASSVTAWHTALPFVFDLQPVETPEQRDQALQRLGKVARYVDTEVTNLRTGLELGYSAPRITVATVAEEMRGLLKDNNPFIGMTTRIDDAEFAAAVRKIFAEQIAPAIERFAKFIDKEYLPAAREEIALSFNPDGAECYPTLVRFFATVSPTADEMHKLGLEQIARIRAEMQAIIDEHFGGGEI